MRSHAPTTLSAFPLVDRDVIPVWVLDHRHPADRRIEKFRDKRHGSLFHLMSKGLKVRHFERHHRTLRSRRMARLRRRDREG